MEKYKFDVSNGLWYELQGDYYIPCLKEPESAFIGVWGQRHKCYLKQSRRAVYDSLFLRGKLDSYLADIDQQAEQMSSQLVNQMAEHEGVTEQLKVEDRIAWVGKMNGIRARATEVINSEQIYT